MVTMMVEKVVVDHEVMREMVVVVVVRMVVVAYSTSQCQCL